MTEEEGEYGSRDEPGDPHGSAGVNQKRDRRLERTREVLSDQEREPRGEADGQPTTSADRTAIEQAVRAENTRQRKKP